MRNPNSPGTIPGGLKLRRHPVVLFNVDQGPVRMKRVLDELLAREATAPSAGGRPRWTTRHLRAVADEVAAKS